MTTLTKTKHLQFHQSIAALLAQLKISGHEMSDIINKNSEHNDIKMTRFSQITSSI